MNVLKLLEKDRKGLLNQKLCATRYKASYNKKCNNNCNICSFKGFENMVRTSEDTNEVLMIKLLNEEQKRTGLVYPLGVLLGFINKSLESVSDHELIALYDYYKDNEIYFDELDKLEDMILNRACLPAELQHLYYFEKVNKAVEILKNK